MGEGGDNNQRLRTMSNVLVVSLTGIGDVEEERHCHHCGKK